ncbi:uncharacterized protein BDZ99DRAFT_568759 [Mytilinidion resinicola]|uniref:Actin-like ATPase domain-containing protein n=1 Tax=Mytilinidion resinicola TaxID=574789 RepID=A0A6A6YXP7_9PEZI|nr:uncharacterized protein BDZ99DRAFT_568759 [Mytilinidion resinicola]KAF2813601.1 hypothetical protein BDZ99DRAFT_568759 [Mytilinidion resinicola]
MANANQGPRIILGLDYGTTYTALAYVNTNGITPASPRDIIVYKSWPGGETQKVPSTISYAECSCGKRCKQWGHNIDDNSLRMQWTKLELEPRSIRSELEVLRDLTKGLDLPTTLHNNQGAFVPRHLAKDAEDVVRDYLYKIARLWYLDIKATSTFALDRIPVDMVVTHPVGWSYEAMNKTFRAITGAFQKGMFKTLRDIYFSTEPEACALNTIQELLAADHHCLVEDLASYKVEQLHPLKLKACGGISGTKCGATQVDRAFLKWVQQRLQNRISERDVTLPGPLVLNPLGILLLRRFEDIKRQFDGRKTTDINLPRNLPGGGTVKVKEQVQTGIQDGTILLTVDDLKDFFEPSVEGTVKLIKQQVIKIQHPADGSMPDQVTNIFLAGGFAESPYLFDEVERRYASKVDIKVFRAEDCWSGVVKGAVLRAGDLGMRVDVKGTRCPRHYGICISRKRDDQLDRITWVVRQGDLITSDSGIKATLVGQCRISSLDLFHSRLARVVFVATDMANPPATLSRIDQKNNEVHYMNVDDIPPVSPQQRSLDVEIRVLQDVKPSGVKPERRKSYGFALIFAMTTLIQDA